MNKEELIDFLKDNLKIELEVVNEIGRSNNYIRKKLKINIFLQDENKSIIKLYKNEINI